MKNEELKASPQPSPKGEGEKKVERWNSLFFNS
jgi:hypothetical protein